MSESGQAGDRPYSVIGALLSYLVPGLGQIVQGRIGKGLLFLVCLLGLFHVGEAMGNWQNVYLPHSDKRDGDNPFNSIINNRWHYAGQFWIGVAAWPAIWQFYNGPVPPPAMPAREDQVFWRNYQKQPTEAEINAYWRDSDKTPDLGWIYTVIAGMLNILVIYDAFAGPAYGVTMPRWQTESSDRGGRADMIFAAALTVPMYAQLPILVVVISLVYSATRYDDWASILIEAYRWGSRMALFLVGIGLALWVLARFFISNHATTP